MKVTRQLLGIAVDRGMLSDAQAQSLWALLEEQQSASPSFRPAHILFYLGGLVAIGAMTVFMNLGWEQHGAGFLLGISSAYCLLALLLTEWLLGRRKLALPAGITAALAVALVPLMTYALQEVAGWWPPRGTAGPGAYRDFHRLIDWRWIYMEAATLVAGALVLWRYRLPFTLLPVAVASWYLSMDVAPLLWGGSEYSWWSTQGKWTSVGTGLVMVAVALFIDIRTRRRPDFAFWLHMAGVAAFWGGLTAMDSSDEWRKAVYGAINLALVAFGAAIERRVYAVFGAFGIAAYLGHLSWEVFRDSLLFPAALAAIGFAVIAIGVWWQRHERAIGDWLRRFWPGWMLRWIEESRG